MSKDPLFVYRQPLVTAAGIILGFVLNFATDLVKRDRSTDLFIGSIILLTLSGIILLIISLYRILNHKYEAESASSYYALTLKLFLWGVLFSFAAGILKMVHTLLLF